MERLKTRPDPIIPLRWVQKELMGMNNPEWAIAYSSDLSVTCPTGRCGIDVQGKRVISSGALSRRLRGH